MKSNLRNKTETSKYMLQKYSPSLYVSLCSWALKCQGITSRPICCFCCWFLLRLDYSWKVKNSILFFFSFARKGNQQTEHFALRSQNNFGHAHTFIKLAVIVELLKQSKSLSQKQIVSFKDVDYENFCISFEYMDLHAVSFLTLPSVVLFWLKKRSIDTHFPCVEWQRFIHSIFQLFLFLSLSL